MPTRIRVHSRLLRGVGDTTVLSQAHQNGGHPHNPKKPLLPPLPLRFKVLCFDFAFGCGLVTISHAQALRRTTDFDLQRHLQQFFPPFMRVVTRSRLRAGFRIGKTKSKTFAPQSHGAAEKSKFKSTRKKSGEPWRLA